MLLVPAGVEDVGKSSVTVFFGCEEATILSRVSSSLVKTTARCVTARDKSIVNYMTE